MFHSSIDSTRFVNHHTKKLRNWRRLFINSAHDDVTRWKRLLHYWPFVMGINRWPVDFRHKGPVMWSSGVSFLVDSSHLLNNNNRVLYDLRRRDALWRHTLWLVNFGIYHNTHELQKSSSRILLCLHRNGWSKGSLTFWLVQSPLEQLVKASRHALTTRPIKFHQSHWLIRRHLSYANQMQRLFFFFLFVKVARLNDGV